MFPLLRQNRAQSRPLILMTGGVAVSLAIVTASCSGGDRRVSLPHSSPPGAPSGSEAPSASHSPLNESEAAKGSYTAYWRILDHADRLPASSRRRDLSVYMVDPQLTRVLNRIDELHANNLTAYGSVIVHIKSVHISGATATLRDCQDSSKAGIQNVTTSKKINRGVAEDHVEAALVRGADGRWRVSKVTGLGQGC